MTNKTVTNMKKTTSIDWQQAVKYGSVSNRTVSIKSVDGRMELLATTVYHKPSGMAGRGVKGRYLLRWEVIDRSINASILGCPPGSTLPVVSASISPVAVMGSILLITPGKTWTYDIKTAKKVAEAHITKLSAKLVLKPV